jgi:2-deoxy-D-gluconate 3-dehydrogenase
MMKWLETMPEAKQAALSRVPLNRMGEEDDMKGLAVFLASPASNYMTGSIVTVDGGYTAK